MKILFTAVLVCSLLVFYVNGDCSPLILSREAFEANSLDLNVTIPAACNNGTIRWFSYTWPELRLNIFFQESHDFQVCFRQPGGFAAYPEMITDQTNSAAEQVIPSDEEICFVSNQHRSHSVVRSIEVKYGILLDYRISTL